VGGQPTDPQMIPQTIIEWPLGNVTVQGSFQEILRYMKRWNQAGRVVAVDGFQIQGTSPFLTASAAITVYIFPKSNAQAQPQGSFGAGGGSFGGPAGGGFDPSGGGVPPGYGPPGGAPAYPGPGTAGIDTGPPS
jgi:hypothetical protein